MKKRIVFELAAGILILDSALYTYVPKSQYMYELYDEEMIMKKTKLTVIVDNIPQGDIKGEWGLSILVEYEDKKILVDAGASGLFAENLHGGCGLCDAQPCSLRSCKRYGVLFQRKQESKILSQRRSKRKLLCQEILFQKVYWASEKYINGLC